MNGMGAGELGGMPMVWECVGNASGMRRECIGNASGKLDTHEAMSLIIRAHVGSWNLRAL